jgi:antitoxin component YwqK of YwqJK toxin-antitoxin module
MNHKIILLILLLSCLGCKTEQINQKIDKKKEGKWIDTYTQDNTQYKSIEYYKNNEPIKKWKSYINGKLHKTEKYKNGICYTKNYYENGKIESKGKTKLDYDSKLAHWYYFGDWKYYSKKGKYVATKEYFEGKLMSERFNP